MEEPDWVISPLGQLVLASRRSPPAIMCIQPRAPDWACAPHGLFLRCWSHPVHVSMGVVPQGTDFVQVHNIMRQTLDLGVTMSTLSYKSGADFPIPYTTLRPSRCGWLTIPTWHVSLMTTCMRASCSSDDHVHVCMLFPFLSDHEV